jgi:CRP-like cAMP-binding protein
VTTRRKTPLEFERIEPQMCSVDLRMAILSKVPFFRNLEKGAIGEINKKFIEKGYSIGETIFFAGDTAERLYVVADGNVTLKQHTLMGQDVLLDVLKPGEFFGSLAILGDDEYSETAVAQTQCCVISIGADEFRGILQDYPRVAIKVIDIMAERLKAAHEMIRQLSKHSVEQRLAHVLLKLADKLGQEKDVGLLIQLPLSRADLAEMIGTTTESASRVMSQFQKEGLVRTGRLWIAITNQEGLLAYKEGIVG